MQRPVGVAQLSPQTLEGSRVAVVAIDITQQCGELREGGGVDAAVALETVPGAGLELLEAPAGPGHPDDRQVEVAAADQGLEGREDLPIGEVTRGAEEDKGVGALASH